MSREFKRNLKFIAAFHVAIVVTLIVCSGWRTHARTRHLVPIPVDFVVELPPAVTEVVAPPSETVEPRTETPPEPEPEPEAVPVPAPKTPSVEPAVVPRKKTAASRTAPAAPSKAKSKEVEASRTVVTRVLDPGKPGKILTPEEIRRMLAAGARPGDHTSAVRSDTLGLQMVRKAFYDAWAQPMRDDAGDAEAVMEIRLAADGTVLDRTLLKRSGNRILDASVLRAAEAVTRIPDLPSDFAMRHGTISVLFRVE